mgnify:CR=1 FL=1
MQSLKNTWQNDLNFDKYFLINTDSGDIYKEIKITLLSKALVLEMFFKKN